LFLHPFEPHPIAQFQDNLIQADNLTLQIFIPALLPAQHSRHLINGVLVADDLPSQRLLPVVLKLKNVPETRYVLVQPGELQSQVLLHVLQLLQLHQLLLSQLLQVRGQLGHLFLQVLHLCGAVPELVVELLDLELLGVEILLSLLEPFLELHNVQLLVPRNGLPVLLLQELVTLLHLLDLVPQRNDLLVVPLDVLLVPLLLIQVRIVSDDGKDLLNLNRQYFEQLPCGSVFT
jgi:hypothetical protein